MIGVLLLLATLVAVVVTRRSPSLWVGGALLGTAILVLEDSDLPRLVADRGNILADGIGENLLYQQFKQLVS